MIVSHRLKVTHINNRFANSIELEVAELSDNYFESIQWTNFIRALSDNIDVATISETLLLHHYGRVVC